ncbi:CubicO group peptidase (beta-lactamase class C family) [Tamaricihabitans halophyticus]|uniref:CubicO group peptidase (Beta-lactamase class C family) n=1 Tax=Tamaricihabitans halophyticus TaxID=1262583 RepID=A0A4R2QFI6_9PSEU|nr:CubicO group peptidase (beta-lactamase class C family) [Tamaricihabitans halophyticus]
MVDIEIGGTVRPQFERVAEAMGKNFASGKEVGAGVCVYHRGEPVVDIWAGAADPEAKRPWQQDTMAALASTTKAMAAGAALLLVERGELELDAPVARYWPEFAAQGKGEITVRTVLSHQSGLVTLEGCPLSLESMKDGGHAIIDELAASTPEWEPGTAHGYHGLTIGHLIGGIVHAITGQTVGTFFASEIATPRGLDCYIGLPEEYLPRVAAIIPPSDEEIMAGFKLPGMEKMGAAINDPSSLPYRALFGSIDMTFATANDPSNVLVEAPSSDGVATATSLARYFAMLIGEVDGAPALLSRALMQQARTVHCQGEDRVLLMPTAWGLGFSLPHGPLFATRPRLGEAFGHGGATGSFALADPERELAFAYIPNRMSELLEGGDLRVDNLVDAVYASVDGD